MGPIPASVFCQALEKEITSLPDKFYDTFEYTATGQTYTHPITLGLVSKIIIGKVSGVRCVGIDFRLDENFNPDIVALSRIEPLEPVLFVDYESPNSSDLRIPNKDIAAYQRWCNANRKRVPYFVITTLPNGQASTWKLKWTGVNKGQKDQVNAAFRQDKQNIQSQIRLNPFAFWYGQYRTLLQSVDLSSVYFININGKKVEHIPLP